eukprot:TRINITY_DN16577_c0_g1_i1.p1 TRINITY_DN16577_c0_g1~~TRINITY_DN16577_c0_g1_i1.p1  ORF type:complete len:181 (+),score=34.83 TRINITY_DN16577_c0_g1_i1:374-916(+)
MSRNEEVSGFDYDGVEVSFPKGQDSFQVEDRTVFWKVDPCNGCLVSGTFSHEPYKDIVGTAEASGMVGTTTFTFDNNGAFCVRGCSISKACPVMSAMNQQTRLHRPNVFRSEGEEEEEDEGSSWQDYEDEKGHGRYSVHENRLCLRYDDGPEECAFFFKFPGKEEQIININGVNFVRKDL